jgi:hypothetical protein
VKEKPTGCTLRVDTVSQALKINPLALQLIHEVNQPAHGSPESVQFPDRQTIILSQIVHRFG